MSKSWRESIAIDGIICEMRLQPERANNLRNLKRLRQMLHIGWMSTMIFLIPCHLMGSKLENGSHTMPENALDDYAKVPDDWYFRVVV